MLIVDNSRSRPGRPLSGLQRVSTRLIQSFGASARCGAWDSPAVRAAGREDWFLTTELFDESERPGFARFLGRAPCRKAAVFHDAIPLRLPGVTWPASVARHPGYLALLADFDLVFAVSEASRDELLSYWDWLRPERRPQVRVLRLGADFDGAPRSRRVAPAPGRGLALLCLGILEPRKNQVFLAECCARLWERGHSFSLHVVGRTNPHFGKPLERRLRELARRHPQLHLEGALPDKSLKSLLERCHATVLPTLAEGCGLPLLESLWQGKPCLCSDLPALRENAREGGCLLLPCAQARAWENALQDLCTEPDLLARLADEAVSRPLPAWADTARSLLAELGEA